MQSARQYAAIALSIIPLALPVRGEGDGPSSPAAKVEAAPKKLGTGSPAPEFKPAEWIQGEPVTAFKKDTTYLIECWATWCGPCVGEIPHLNDLHHKFKDKGLVVIGVNLWEKPVEKARKFVKAKGDGMAYRVAFDGGAEGNISTRWMKAANQEGIPHTFVVRNNQIIWQGHPGELDEQTVTTMVEGKYTAPEGLDESVVSKPLAEICDEDDAEFDRLVVAKKFEEAEKSIERRMKGLGHIDELKPHIPEFESADRAKIAIARGDLAGAVALLKRSLPADDEKGTTVVTRWMDRAENMLTIPGLGKARDFQFALDCVNKSAAAEEGGDRSPVLRLFKAYALYGLGKKDECIKVLEQIDQNENLFTGPEAFKFPLNDLKEGKPWPKDRLNPDGN